MNLITDITNFIFIDDIPQKCDIIFIPGSSYAEVPERAAMLWKSGYSKYLLPSGRYSITKGIFAGPSSKSDIYQGTYDTEYEFFKDVLLKNNVDESAILKEDKAQFTYENAYYSEKVTDECNLTIKSAIICCKSYHTRRALMYYEYFFPQTKFFMCPVDVNNLTKDNWFKSSSGIDMVLGELKRCGEQFKDMLIKLNAES